MWRSDSPLGWAVNYLPEDFHLVLRQIVTNDFKTLGGEIIEKEEGEERTGENFSLLRSSCNYQELHGISNTTPHPHPTSKMKVIQVAKSAIQVPQRFSKV